MSITKAGITTAVARTLAKRDANASLWANIFEPSGDLSDQLAAMGLHQTELYDGGSNLVGGVLQFATVNEYMVLQWGVESFGAGGTVTVTMPQTVDHHIAVFTQTKSAGGGTYNSLSNALTTTGFDLYNPIGGAVDVFWLSLGYRAR